jgi:tRNA modification GTPase
VNTKTIAALSTPRGTGAIAVVRVSGPRAISAVEKCLDPFPEFRKCEPQRIKLYRLVSPRTRKIIDQITAVKYEAPHSFTGEDMVELFCHGGRIVVEKALSMLMDEGVDLAKRGEFTRRAFLNGKFDLLKAESILGLIESSTEKEYTASLEAYMGGSSARLIRWKESVKNVLRDIEAAIEFPDEADVKKSNGGHIERIAEIRKEIEMEAKKRLRSHIIEKGIVVPVVGIANAGKSSLFNVLLGFDRSIVHSQEGTTRDGVGEDIQISGEKVTILDTAGLRETNNEVEQLGIQRTWDYIRKAAMVIWVTPADRDITAQERLLTNDETREKTICVISKIDIGDPDVKKKFCMEEKVPWVSACLLDSKGREGLVRFVGASVEKNAGAIETSNVIRTKRHEIIARRMIGSLLEAEKDGSAGEEIVSVHLQRFLSEIGDLAGETANEEILDSIFSEFCIGK